MGVGMGGLRVIAAGYAERVPQPAPRPAMRLAPVDGAAGSRPDCGFTSHDLIALTCWMERVDGHGYRRMLIERGSGGRSPDEGGYALVYGPGSEWASWGLTRAGTEVLAWRCADGTDLGRFPSMLQALDRLPPVWTRSARVRPIGLRPKPTGRLPRCPRVCPG